MPFAHENKLSQIISKLQDCSNELHGMGLLGAVSGQESDALSMAGMDADSLISDLEDIINGEIGDEEDE
jgi:hypothetical protein